MGSLIIYAHPDIEGHCSTVLKEVEKELKIKKLDYELIDLYKIKYDPVMYKEELYTAGRRKVSAQNKRFQKKIQESDSLIIIYPVWWSGMPAILKGFFDKVFTPHFAFKYEGIQPRGLLKDKKAIVIITSGAPAFLSKIILGDRPRKLIKNDILNFCGIKTKVYQIGSCNVLDQKKKKKIKKIVKKAIRNL